MHGKKSSTSTSIIATKKSFNFNDIIKAEKEQQYRSFFLSNKLKQQRTRNRLTTDPFTAEYSATSANFDVDTDNISPKTIDEVTFDMQKELNTSKTVRSDEQNEII